MPTSQMTPPGTQDASATTRIAEAWELLRSQPDIALALAARLHAEEELPPDLGAAACALASTAALHLGDQNLTETWARQGLASTADDPALKGRLLSNLGISLHQRGSFAEANRILGQALALARKSGDRGAQARALANVGIARSEASRFEDALGYFREALDLLQGAREDRVLQSLAIQVSCHLGVALVGLDRVQEGLAEIETSVLRSRASGDTLTLCFALMEKGRGLDAIGSRHEAREALEDSLTIALLFGMNLVGVRSAALLAHYHLDEGDLDGAEAILEQWLPLAASGDSLRHADLLRLRGRILALRGRWQEAFYESERASLMEVTGGPVAAAAASLSRSQSSLRRRARLLSERIEGWSEAVIKSLATLIEARDGPTGAHLDRSARVVGILGEALAARGELPRLGRGQLDRIVHLTPLHDVGKVAVPDEILRKPGPLDRGERLLMQRHAIVGREIFLDAAKATHFDPLAATAAEIAGSHHERWDGTGYPDGLAGTDIPFSARIVALADVYDAIRSERPYKPGRSHGEASAYIVANSGAHFDPAVVAAFVECEAEIAALYH